MAKIEPFLLAFKKEILPKNNLLINSCYDQSIDMTVVIQDGVRLPAIDTNYRLGTKKADMERGEDQKDSMLWG